LEVRSPSPSDAVPDSSARAKRPKKLGISLFL
jgi:hypothetical protein